MAEAKWYVAHTYSGYENKVKADLEKTVGKPVETVPQIFVDVDRDKVLKQGVNINDVYKTYFSGNFPARSAFGSNGLAFNARVEVECIAAWRK